MEWVGLSAEWVGLDPEWVGASASAGPALQNPASLSEE